MRFLFFFCVYIFGIHTCFAQDNSPPSPHELLNKALRRIQKMIVKQDKVTPLDEPFLRKPKGKDPLEVFKDIVRATVDLCDEKKPYKMHVNGFADLASTLLDIVIKRTMPVYCTNSDNCQVPSSDIKVYQEAYPNISFISENTANNINAAGRVQPQFSMLNDEYTGVKEDKFSSTINKFRKSIDYARTNKSAHYSWFMIFSDQLSILITKLLGVRSYSAVNTGYHQHLYDIDQGDFPNFTSEHYKIKTLLPHMEYLGNFERLILQFPYVTMMPYPFDLAPIDLINLSLESEYQLFWPCGFAFRPVAADGWYHCPRNFFGHDWHHLILRLWSMLSLCLPIKDPSQINWDKLKQTIKYTDKIFFKTFDLYLKDMSYTYSIINSIADDDIRQIYAFFAFYLHHEGVRSIFVMYEPMDFDDEVIVHPLYYKGLYPKSMQDLNDDDLRSELKRHYADWSNIRQNNTDIKKIEQRYKEFTTTLYKMNPFAQNKLFSSLYYHFLPVKRLEIFPYMFFDYLHNVIFITGNSPIDYVNQIYISAISLDHSFNNMTLWEKLPGFLKGEYFRVKLFPE